MRVSVCTCTYNRHHFLPLLAGCLASQDYDQSLIEWVVVDDSPRPCALDLLQLNSGVEVVYRHSHEKLSLGRKRNLSHELCRGDIIVYMDDDDFYPCMRIQRAVDALLGSYCLIAGSSAMPILFLDDGSLWMAGPYGPNHATAGTFAFKRELLEITRYQDGAVGAEERFFLKNYEIPMVQLHPFETIICMAHAANTFDKKQLRQRVAVLGPEKAHFRQVTLEISQQQIVDQLLNAYRSVA